MGILDGWDFSGADNPVLYPNLPAAMVQPPGTSMFPRTGYEQPSLWQGPTDQGPTIPVSQVIDPSLMHVPGTGANALYHSALDKAADIAMAFSGGGLGIRAFHGSPFDFDRFDISKVGTGEGAQAYGHGLYFAEHEPVAQSYRDRLTGRNDTADFLLSDNSGKIPFWAGRQIAQYPPGHEYYNSVIDNLKDVFKSRMAMQDDQWAMQPWIAEDNKRGLQAIIDNLGRLRSGEISLVPKPTGKMYEVNLNAEPSQFLDWDKPLSEQPHVVNAMRQYGYGDAPWPYADKLLPEGGGILTDLRGGGEGALRALEKTMGGQSQASEALLSQGIPGIRYLDQGSRGAGQGTSNYAVFSDKIIDILRKYGFLAPVAGGGLLAGYEEGR